MAKKTKPDGAQEALARWIKERGYLNRYVATELLNVNPVTLSRWINRASTPIPAMRQRIADMTDQAVMPEAWGCDHEK